MKHRFIRCLATFIFLTFFFLNHSKVGAQTASTSDEYIKIKSVNTGSKVELIIDYQNLPKALTGFNLEITLPSSLDPNSGTFESENKTIEMATLGTYDQNRYKVLTMSTFLTTHPQGESGHYGSLSFKYKRGEKPQDHDLVIEELKVYGEGEKIIDQSNLEISAAYEGKDIVEEKPARIPPVVIDQEAVIIVQPVIEEKVEIINVQPVVEPKQTKTFADIQNHWAKGDIEFVASLDIVKGKTETEFVPGSEITRAEFAALVVRVLGLNNSNPMSNDFSDVNNNDWFFKEVAAAYRAGIIKGVNEKEFDPHAKITREQMAVMIVRTLQYAVQRLDIPNGQIQQNLTKFADASKISSWAVEDTSKAVEWGIVNGKGNGIFSPQTNATRAESAVMIRRLYEKIQ